MYLNCLWNVSLHCHCIFERLYQLLGAFSMDVFSCANRENDDLWINVNMSIVDFKSLTIPNCELLDDQVDFVFLVFKCNLLHIEKIRILKEDMLINILIFFVSWSPYLFYGFVNANCILMDSCTINPTSCTRNQTLA